MSSDSYNYNCSEFTISSYRIKSLVNLRDMEKHSRAQCTRLADKILSILCTLFIEMGIYKKGCVLVYLCLTYWSLSQLTK